MQKFNWDHCSLVFKGILVGLVSGIMVSLFRFFIQRLLVIFAWLYQSAGHSLGALIGVIIINLAIAILVSRLMLQNKNIKGSGIPQVEGQLMQKMDYKFFPVLWRKFVGGVLAIGSGLFLGREGPSIQIGSTSAQGISELFHQTGHQKRLLIAGGAAAGLSAAFNAPIASTIFVLEEIYHRFDTDTWLLALPAALGSNFVSTVIFGQVPVLHIILGKSLPLNLYPYVVVLGMLLGVLGIFYQFVTLHINRWYLKLFPQLKNYLLVIPMLLVIPIGIYVPQTLGGGNSLILSFGKTIPGISVFLGYFVLRFLFSALSYGTGTPGGIFLPMLSLGAIIGGFYGQLLVLMGVYPEQFVVNLIVISMAGYFGAISKSPFTAILLVTEMVGTLEHLMAISIVTLVAYLILDMLGGKPIYTTMLNQLLTGIKDEH